MNGELIAAIEKLIAVNDEYIQVYIDARSKALKELEEIGLMRQVNKCDRREEMYYDHLLQPKSLNDNIVKNLNEKLVK